MSESTLNAQGTLRPVERRTNVLSPKEAEVLAGGLAPRKHAEASRPPEKFYTPPTREEWKSFVELPFPANFYKRTTSGETTGFTISGRIEVGEFGFVSMTTRCATFRSALALVLSRVARVEAAIVGDPNCGLKRLVKDKHGANKREEVFFPDDEG